jgi:putative ABC transport system permease protein
MTAGRFINWNDTRDYRKVVVIGKNVVSSLFKNRENPMGKYIKIQGVYFEVVGTYKSKKSGNQADQENNSLFLPFTSMQRTFNYGDRVGWFAITSKDNIPATVTEAKVLSVMKKAHHINPKDDQAIGHFNMEKQFKKVQGLFNGINGLIWIVGTGTLLAGIIGISNIMLIIVKERTNEIGVKRALGATPLDVITQIILESVTLTAVAGYTGLVLGVGLLALIDKILVSSGAKLQYFLHPEISFKVGVTALVILVVSGVFAGLIPAKRAVSIKPVDALRDE